MNTEVCEVEKFVNNVIVEPREIVVEREKVVPVATVQERVVEVPTYIEKVVNKVIEVPKIVEV